jgi:two-component system sensor histidine kinase/response regulator
MNDTGAKQRVLLAEGNRLIYPVRRDVLTQSGYRVEEVADGIGAVAAAAAQPYTLILMDPNLPKLDGLEATRRIRRLPRPRGEVPILGMSPAAGDKDRCLGAGMDGFLVKPLGRVALLEAVSLWGDASEDAAPPLLSRRTIAQLEEDVGPERLPDILRTFLTETNRRLRLLAARVEARDAGGVAEEAHALKGSTGTFGAMALRQTAFEIEQAGRIGDLERIGQLIPELDRLAGETCGLLRAEYPFLPP